MSKTDYDKLNDRLGDLKQTATLPTISIILTCIALALIIFGGWEDKTVDIGLIQKDIGYICERLDKIDFSLLYLADLKTHKAVNEVRFTNAHDNHTRLKIKVSKNTVRIEDIEGAIVPYHMNE
jgi:hypothetical protein